MAFRLSPQAELDLLELWSFVAADVGEQRADSLADAITDACWMLSEYPRAGRIRREFGPNVRSFPVAGYVIYYRVADIVLIARVLHGRRHQTAAWDEEE